MREGEEICGGRFKLQGQPIGEGGYCSVWMAVARPSGAKVAVKQLHAGDEDGRVALLRELRLQWWMRGCKQIPAIFGAVANCQGGAVLVMEHLDFDLDSWIRAPQGSGHSRMRPTLRHARLLIYQLLHALDSLHRAGVVHRDIKAKNIMLHRTWLVKLIDLGEGATAVDAGNYDEARRGVPQARAPELLFTVQRHTSATDVWSCGVVFQRLLHAVYAPRLSTLESGAGGDQPHLPELYFQSGPGGQGLNVVFCVTQDGLVCDCGGQRVTTPRASVIEEVRQSDGHAMIELRPQQVVIPLPHDRAPGLVHGLRALAVKAGAGHQLPAELQQGALPIDETDENFTFAEMSVGQSGITPRDEDIRRARLYNERGYYAAVAERVIAAAGRPAADVLQRAGIIDSSAEGDKFALPPGAAAGLHDDWPHLCGFAAAFREAPECPPPDWAQLWPGADGDAVSLLRGLLTFDPAQRLTAAQGLQHGLFAAPGFAQEAAQLVGDGFGSPARALRGGPSPPLAPACAAPAQPPPAPRPGSPRGPPPPPPQQQPQQQPQQPAGGPAAAACSRGALPPPSPQHRAPTVDDEWPLGQCHTAEVLERLVRDIEEATSARADYVTECYEQRKKVCNSVLLSSIVLGEDMVLRIAPDERKLYSARCRKIQMMRHRSGACTMNAFEDREQLHADPARRVAQTPGAAVRSNWSPGSSDGPLPTVVPARKAMGPVSSPPAPPPKPSKRKQQGGYNGAPPQS